MSDIREHRRTRRPARSVGGIIQRPFKQLSRPYAPIEVLTVDHLMQIHETALTVHEEIGMRVLEPRARDFYRKAGLTMDEGDVRVRFDRAMAMDRLKTVPSSFELHARNPERNLKVGGTNCILSSVGGPAEATARETAETRLKGEVGIDGAYSGGHGRVFE